MTTLRTKLESIVGSSAIAEAAEARCRACDNRGLEAFYETPSIPGQSCVLLDTAQEASDHPSGDLLLGFCPACGFIENTRFDPTVVDYTLPTEESQAYSPTFREFARRLAGDLLERYDLQGKAVLEIGSGKGDFLALLSGLGIGRGLGVDPGFLPNRPPSGNVDHIRDFFTDDYSDLTGDLVLSRHLLEHVPDALEMTRRLARATRRTAGAHLFTEVPDVDRVLTETAFWDIYYEHCSYYTLGSLSRLLDRAGLETVDIGLGFADQYLLAHSRPGTGPLPSRAESVDELGSRVVEFAAQATRTVEEWRRALTDAAEGGDRVALWGGGSKAVAFLTTLAIPTDAVTVVDINPFKQGKYLPGAAVEVDAPEVLAELRPDLVVVMNPIYEEEIRSALGSMGLSPRVRTLC